MVIVSLIFYSDIFGTAPIISFLVKVTGVLLFLIFLLFIVGLYNPGPVKTVISFIIMIFYKLKLTKHPDEYKNKILKHILLARDSFNKFMGKKFLYLLVGFILSFFMLLSVILMILSFIKGFGIHISIFRGIAITSSLIFLVTFLPTPGSSGLGEGVYYLLYKDYIPSHIIGILMFLWRFFAQYLTSFLGAIVAIKYYSDNELDSKIRKK